jgi:hypothetical protein
MKRNDILFALTLVVLAVAMVLMFMTDRPVCHAPTEDSAPTDCHYEDGAWRKR